MADRGALLRRILEGIGEQPHALIGGQALLVHGLARQTDDIDLLVGTCAVLDPSRWVAGDPPVVLRRATDASDPLDGVAVLESETDDDGAPVPGSPVATEAIVIDRPWARAILGRARQRASIAGVDVPVVELADLVILKVYAGGPVDRADVAAISERPDWPEVRRSVEERLVDGPKAGLRNWRRWLPLIEPG